MDPTLCRADRLVGQVLGAVGALPEIYIILEISFFLLRRLLGVRTEGDQQAAKVWRRRCRRLDPTPRQVSKLTKGETLMVNIGSLSTGGRVVAVKADLAKIELTLPVCTEACATADFSLAKCAAGGRENRAEPPRGQALAPDWLGPNPQGHHYCAGRRLCLCCRREPEGRLVATMLRMHYEIRSRTCTADAIEETAGR